MTPHFHLKTRSAAKLPHISATSALPSPLVWHREIIEGETLTYCGHRVEETLGADPRLFRFICLLAWRNIPCRPPPPRAAAAATRDTLGIQALLLPAPRTPPVWDVVGRL